MKLSTRLLTLGLLLSLCLTTATGCNSPADGGDTSAATTVEETAPATKPETDPETQPETETEIPEVKLTVDSSYRIVIAAEADAITQNAAALVAAAIKEKAGLELPVITDAEAASGKELVLGHTNRTAATEEGYVFSVNGDTLYLDAADSTDLYFAAEAVMGAWLTEDFGLADAGCVTLPVSRVADLNGLTTRRDNSIKVMTQNMRNSDDPDGNSVSTRYDRFVQMLADYKPDVIGTQENGTNWMIRLEKLFKKMDDSGNGSIYKYGMVGESVEGAGKTGGGRNTILYRMDRFELVETGTFWLSETPEYASTLPRASHMRTCTWATLKDKQTGETILVANTHLDHTSSSFRLAQMNILLEYLSEKFSQYPCYLTGDMNTGSHSDTYAAITETFQDSHKTAWADLSTETGTFHGYSGHGYSEIDFVFHDDSSTPVSYEIISKDYDGVVSDHFGVMSEFVLD